MKRFIPIFFFILIGFPTYLTASGACCPEDSLALLCIYLDFDGPNWTNNTNWLSGPVHTWHGVTVENNRVTRLDLYDNNLRGEIPTDIVKLDTLQFLRLSSNQISGQIPAKIGEMKELKNLYLSVNQLEGTIPASISDCSNLTILSVFRNKFSGPFPEGILSLTRLENLIMDENDFTGPLPARIGELSNLRVLSILRNDFSGEVPSLANLTKLAELHLDDNNFSGQLSDFMAYFPESYYFTFSNNDFSGCISNSYFNPEKLQFTSFSYNQFDCLEDFSDFRILERLWVINNKVPFEYLLPNIEVTNFEYTPMDSLLTPANRNVRIGASINILAGSAGSGTSYQWFKDGMPINDETGRTLSIGSFTIDDEGSYTCEMKNTTISDLTLWRHAVHLMEDVSTGISPLSSINVEVSPNPALDLLTISCAPVTGAPLPYQIIDSQGRLLGSGVLDLSQGKAVVEIAQLSQGMYFVRGQLEQSYFLVPFLKM